MLTFKFVVAVTTLAGGVVNVFTSAADYSVELAEQKAVAKVMNICPMSELISVQSR